MTGDDFLDGLKADWKAQAIDLDALRGAVGRREREMRRQWRRNLPSAAVFFVMALLFAFRAWERHDPLFALGSVVFLVGLAILAAETRLLRQAARADYLVDAGQVLARAAEQARTTLALLDRSLWSAGLLGAGALGAFLLVALGTVRQEAALLIAPLWLLAALAVYLWQRARRARVLTELAHYRAMAADLARD